MANTKGGDPKRNTTLVLSPITTITSDASTTILPITITSVVTTTAPGINADSNTDNVGDSWAEPGDGYRKHGEPDGTTDGGKFGPIPTAIPTAWFPTSFDFPWANWKPTGRWW